MSGLAVRTGAVLICGDIETDSRVDRETARRLGIRSMISVPLQESNRTEGVLHVVSDLPHAFDRGDAQLLEQLAEFIATALHRANVMDERQRVARIGVPVAKRRRVNPHTRSLRTIIDVQHAINSAENSADAVMRIVVEKAREATRAAGAAVELVEGNELIYAITSGMPDDFKGRRGEMSSSLSGLAVRTGMVLISDDTETDERVNRIVTREANVRSVVVVPLQHDNLTEGVLQVVSDKPHAFNQDDADLLERLAQFIGTALHRATVMGQREQDASIDPLTGLDNRHAFLAGLDRVIATAVSEKYVVGVLYLDLDGFKPVNDTYGHAVGDEVLRAVGHRIGAKCRAPDMAARIGGDEFAALLVAPEHRHLVERCDHLQGLVQEPIPTSAGELQINVSCGLAVVAATDLAESVLARADAAMYADKRAKYGTDSSRR
ncbi:MAG TPA: sensor domain-containing diguanylate cyclase [Mycobacterium sp.]|nr:sensor domain-containing diguanylate cyclase [Mycobacterium sp.]HQE16670.1 sensor domain-containing diguanylate cyclase [Mycobacterium sp.]